jgi:UDPglucose--hexose-1-phosphate uridylyltransferase
MSDLRHDPIDDVWVAMAGNRRARPMEFLSVGQRRQQMVCPFCKGNEAETPEAIIAFGETGQLIPKATSSPEWLARVISNKYPSFSSKTGEQTDSHDNFATQSLPPPFRVSGNPGHQELIIPSPRHCISIGELTDRELAVSFLAMQNRLKAIRKDDDVKHVMLFLNCRSDAGASLGHVHWQLIGTPLVSGSLKRRADRELAHQQDTNESLVKKLTDWELQQQTRVVRQTDHFCLVCPFASRFPFQVNIVPKDPRLNLLNCEQSIRNELAHHCRDVVQGLETLLDNAAYNILLQLPPMERIDDDPWFFQIFPRITKQAGFELGTDIWINPVAPETAARAIRSSLEKSQV